jgi:ABC-type Fe3+-hydroxamate transport system substrate-binding protein
MRSLNFKSFIFFFSIILIPSISQAGGPPKKIVSLAPSITKSLYYLGEIDNIIGVTSYCEQPDGVTKEIIGTLKNPNIEKIFSLSPDLILTIEGVANARSVKKLKSLGLNVITLSQSGDFNDIVMNFVILGELTGKEKKTKEIISDVTKELKLITDNLAGTRPIRVFWEVNASPLVTISDQSFANDIIRYAGGINIFSNAPVLYPRVSREEILKKDPEVIMLITMGDVTEKEKEYWYNFKDLKAVKNNRIYVIDTDKVCYPTPASFLEGVKEVTRCFHPKIEIK